MKKSHKYVLLGLIAIAAAVFLLLQVVNSLAGRNRELVRQELQKVLGREVHFEQLEASLLGGFGFSAKEFRVADHPRFAATPLVRARELIMGMSFWNLLVGRIVIHSLILHEPEFQIITDEAGQWNLAEPTKRKKEAGTFSAFPSLSPETKNSAVMILVTKLQIRNGRIEYLDRSVKEPAEMRVRNVELDLSDLAATKRAKIRFAASITEGLGRDVRIEGRLGPAGQRSWSQQPIDLEIQFDSLHVPAVRRAIAFLRDKIPRELDVTGPLSLQAKLTGTLARPRITDITLRAPLFGASDYNAILKGAADLSQSGSWVEAQLHGSLTLKPVNLAQLRNLPFFKRYLPAPFSTDGTVAISTRFEGTWLNLRIGALINGDNGEFRYRDWLRKPLGSLTQLRAKVSRERNGLKIHESSLIVGNSKMQVSGQFKTTPELELHLRLQSEDSLVAAWNQFFPPLPYYGVTGRADWDISIDKNLSMADGSWDLRGGLRIKAAELKHKESGRKIEQINGHVIFLGRQARLEDVAFRLGSSRLIISATVPDIAEPLGSYQLRSADLNLGDLPGPSVNGLIRLKNLTGSGDFHMRNGITLLKGNFTSPDGIIQVIPYQNLRAQVGWSPKGVSINSLSLQALDGKFRADGFWFTAGEGSQSFELASQIESADIRAILTRTLYPLKDRIDGQLNFDGQFAAVTDIGGTLSEALKGSGELLITKGTMRDFNLIKQLLLRNSNDSVAAKLSSRLPPKLMELVNHRDTPFDTLTAKYKVEQQRIHFESLLLSTANYTISGAGWIGFDRSTKINGLLVFSPHLTQEFQREYASLRYLMDRRGRLSLSFRWEGTLPDVAVRFDRRNLTHALRLGSYAPMP